MYLETFFSDYLTKITMREKLVFLHEKAQKLIDDCKGKEASLISIFIELLDDNVETLGKIFNSNQNLSDNELINLIAKGNYFLIKGRKENNPVDLQNSIKSFESARLQTADIPYITIRLASAYRYTAALTKGEREAKKNFNESVRLITESLEKLNDNKVILSYFYNELGNTHLDMREYENAEIFFTKAIETNEKLPFAYTGMGNFYRSKNEYMRAIEQYNQALKRLQYNKNNLNNHKECIYPLNYLGDCFRFIEDYRRAEEMYIKAIYVDPNHPFPWHGLGRVHYELGNRNCNNNEYYEIAMEYFKKTKELNPRFKYVLSSLGSISYKMGEYEEAIKYYNDARKQFPKSQYHDELAAKSIAEIRDKIKLNKKIKNIKEKAYGKRLSPEEKIIVDTIDRKIDEKITLMKNNFAQTFLKAKFYDNPDNKEKITLEILRRWNSYTPIITENSKGGGYFINAYDKGIVIDPGFNFIDNFKDTGHVFSDIDIVLLSHAMMTILPTWSL
jgi:tetratricopeptide (TPR) repeat protein